MLRLAVWLRVNGNGSDPRFSVLAVSASITTKETIARNLLSSFDQSTGNFASVGY